MTVHGELQMQHEDRRITDKELIKGILDRNTVCTVALHDEPYPYVVPMNYGYAWEEELVFYCHMAKEGHRLDLLEKNENISVNICSFLDRYGYRPFRKEGHDYRSVNIFGKGSVLSSEQKEEFLKGLNCLCERNGRPTFKRLPGKSSRLYILKITAEEITAKAQYLIHELREVEMPPLEKKG